jgi:L-aminopeptidase/D-esterase-like protein
MWMNVPPEHPVWKILHSIVLAICVTFTFAICAYVTANSFDTNEIQMLAGGGSVVAVVSAGMKFLKS